jgi:hypothetical protein
VGENPFLYVASLLHQLPQQVNRLVGDQLFEVLFALLLQVDQVRRLVVGRRSLRYGVGSFLFVIERGRPGLG